MYSVLIAEDELLVRMGLQASIPWEQMDMFVVACEADGLSALEKYHLFKPDIVVADILMPGLDGFSLVREIREEGGRCPVIFVTSINPERAAEGAAELGIADYLIKATMTKQDIVAAVMRAKYVLTTQEHDARITKTNDLYRLSLERDAALTAYLAREEKASDSSSLLISEKRASLVMIRMYGVHVMTDVLRHSVSSLAKEQFAEYQIIAAASHGQDILLMLKYAPSDDRRAAERHIKALEEFVLQSLAVRLLFVISLTIKPADALRETIDSLRQQIDRQQETHNEFIWNITHDLPDEQAFVAGCDTLEESLWLIAEPGAVLDAYEQLRRIQNDYHAARQTFAPECWKLYGMITRKQTNNTDGVPSSVNLWRMLTETASALAVDASFRPEIGRIIAMIVNDMGNVVSVNRAAEMMHFHPVYFSSLFKQQTGATYTHYVQRLRIEKAKRMLKQRNCELSDVAYQCGFRDVAYFIRVFKQYTGMTPGAWGKSS